jgi:hypothetical protein
MILKNIFAEKLSKNIGIFRSNCCCCFSLKFDHNVVFLEKRQFFRRQLAKIAENCIITWTPDWASR